MSRTKEELSGRPTLSDNAAITPPQRRHTMGAMRAEEERTVIPKLSHIRTRGMGICILSTYSVRTRRTRGLTGRLQSPWRGWQDFDQDRPTVNKNSYLVGCHSADVLQVWHSWEALESGSRSNQNASEVSVVSGCDKMDVRVQSEAAHHIYGWPPSAKRYFNW